MRSPRFIAMSVAALLSIAGARTACGQNALGDGRSLDSNLSQQTKQNNQVKDVAAQIRFSQRVAEGQAGGGRSFRGNLGYRAVDDFADSLGVTVPLQLPSRFRLSRHRRPPGSALQRRPALPVRPDRRGAVLAPQACLRLPTNFS